MRRERHIVKGTLLVLALLTFFLPRGGIAGSLEPSAAPAPTMRTLQEIYDKVIEANRWSVGADTVLDRKTGLTWAKAPDHTTRTWNDAVSYCSGLTLGGKDGWRLPTIDELNILVDKNQSDPALPLDNPFVGIESQYFWSSSIYAPDTDYAWTNAIAIGYVQNIPKTLSCNVWPVRDISFNHMPGDGS